MHMSWLTHLRNKREGNCGLTAFKLDMSKAYDRVEWSFLDRIVKMMEFSEKWINLIMLCYCCVIQNQSERGFYRNNMATKGAPTGWPIIAIPIYYLCWSFLGINGECGKKRAIRRSKDMSRRSSCQPSIFCWWLTDFYQSISFRGCTPATDPIFVWKCLGPGDKQGKNCSYFQQEYTSTNKGSNDGWTRHHPNCQKW